jgi:hypothetical protein
MLVEHEYERKGAWAYLAAWDVRRAKIFGRCELNSGIAPRSGSANWREREGAPVQFD